MNTYNNLATFLNDTGESQRALEVIDDALALAHRRGLFTHFDWSCMTLSEVLFKLGEWDRLREVVATQLGLERVAGSQTRLGVLMFHCFVTHREGDPVRAWAMFADVLDATRALKDPQALVLSVAAGAGMALDAGESDAAKELIDEFARALGGHPIYLSLGLSWTTEPMAKLGMVDELEALLARAGRPYPWIDAELRATEARIAAAHMRHAEALELIGPLIAAADERGLKLPATTARLDAAEYALAVGNQAKADDLLDEAETGARSMGAGLYLSRIDDLRTSLHQTKEA